MKKAKTNSKKRVVETDTKKNRSYIYDMMKRDMDSCRKRGEKLAAAGIKTPTKDIFKDDCCYGCWFAVENKDDNLGPFDRRYKCRGVSRAMRSIAEAHKILTELLNYNPQADIWHQKTTREEAVERLMAAQKQLLDASSLIGVLVTDKTIACVDKKKNLYAITVQ